ncbi:MAG TPA: hypothetical protein VEA16_03355 [Vicinamibacterales bacterium]|nr:hypothetical protein [Vicinamibacterales bacterium]
MTTALAFSASVLSAPIIELTDGSRVQGDIQGIEGGIYTIVSPALGTLRIPQAKIARIVYDGGGESGDAPASGNDALASQMAQLQAQLARDPGVMQLIQQLQSDPQIQALLNDPQIMQAIQQGDYASLMNNAKIRALENNAQLKQLLQQVQP